MLNTYNWKKVFLSVFCSLLMLAVSLRGGDHAYVTNYSGTVNVIDLSSNTVISTISVGGKPHSIGLTPDGKFALFTNLSKPVVDIVDTSTNTIWKSLPLTSPSSWIVVNPVETGSIFLLAETDSKISSYLWLNEHLLPRRVDEGDYKDGINGMALSPDGKHLCISTLKGAGFQGVGLAVYEGVGVGSLVGIAEVGIGPSRIAITPDSKYAYVVNTITEQGGISVVELSSAQTVASIGVGFAPKDIAVASDGERAYVVNHMLANISVIDTSINKVVATIPVAGSLSSIALSKDSQFAYVVDEGNNCVHVVDLSKEHVTDSIPVGKNPMNIFIND